MKTLKGVVEFSIKSFGTMDQAMDVFKIMKDPTIRKDFRIKEVQFNSLNFGGKKLPPNQHEIVGTAELTLDVIE